MTGNASLMLDTHAIARTLSAADLTSAQVDAITAGIAAAAQYDAGGIDLDKLATKADVTAVAGEIRTEMAAMETRLTWRLVGAMAAVGAILRFIG